MSDIPEICANCQHATFPPDYASAKCLVWKHRVFKNELCQHFQPAERLLPRKTCFMCRSEKPKGDDWIKLLTGDFVCSTSCLNNYCNGADMT